MTTICGEDLIIECNDTSSESNTACLVYTQDSSKARSLVANFDGYPAIRLMNTVRRSINSQKKIGPFKDKTIRQEEIVAKLNSLK